MPLSTSGLVTTDDLEDFLGVTFDATTLPRASQAIAIASATVRSQTGQGFSAGTSTVTLLAPHDEWIDLPQRPVTAITSVTVNGTAVTDYTLVNDRLHRPSWLDWSSTAPATVTVSYAHGGTVPDDVQGAVLMLAAEVYENPRGLTSETIDDYSWRSGEGSSPARDALAAVVRTYRRRPLIVPIR